MKLIIAEKPMLGRAIAQAIDGKTENKDGYMIKGDYCIVAAFGHLLTLKEPEDYDFKYKTWSLDALPIYFNDWGKKPSEGKLERLNLIGELLKQADCVIHAGDPDDEGQYLIDEILQWFNYQGPVYRLSTGDTTEASLRKALTSMKDNKLFENFGWSAHARSVADIMVGYNFSRYFSLTNSHVKMLTVGRVQTPTLGLVVRRDLAIENHNKLCYYTIKADLDIEENTVTALFEPAKDDPNLEEGKITDKEYAEEICASLKDASIDNIKITLKEIIEQPPLPFNLVKLQTYCSNKFGYDPTKTLEITQSLRDNHNAITYNRSDCQYLSEEQYKESPATLKQVIENLKDDAAGKVFSKLPVDTKLHSNAFNDKNITAHTAIIPQNRRFDITKLSEEERNVYLAIAKYFFAQFLEPASKQRTSLEAAVEMGTLKANSTKTQKPGFLILIKPEKKTEEISEDDEVESDLSSIKPGEYSGLCTNCHADEKETKAPPRYTKASLNEDMTRIAKYVTDPVAKKLLLEKDKEKKGENGSIGTSATRSTIIDNLEARGFIQSKGKQIYSTVLGRELYRILPDELKKPDMTGLWWAVQQSIQEGAAPWTKLTDSVLDMINKVIHTSYPKVDAYHVPESLRRGKLLLGPCPRCGKDVIEGTNGFGCSGFKEGCKFVIWKNAKQGMMSKIEITPDMVHTFLTSKWIDEERIDEQGSKSLTGKKRTIETIYFKRLYSENKKKNYPGKVYLCDDGPSSEYGASFGLSEIVNEPPKPLGKCPRCGCDVIEGKYGYGCNGYKEGCKFIIWKRAKSGMMSKTKVTKGLVRNLLKSKWISDTRDLAEGSEAPENYSKIRTEKEVHIRKLYSTKKDVIYTGDVFLTDDKTSDFGAAFGLARITNDGPEILGKCPRCGKDIIESDRFYGCTGFKEGCKFAIWKKQKQKMLAKISFTKTDAKRFLSGKPTTKSKLLDKKEKPFKAQLIMEETPDNPFGPVFRVVEGTIEVKDGDPSEIKIDTVKMPEQKNEQ